MCSAVGPLVVLKGWWFCRGQRNMGSSEAGAAMCLASPSALGSLLNLEGGWESGVPIDFLVGFVSLPNFL